MKITKKDQIVLLQVLYSGFVAIGFSYLIGLATSSDALLVGAIPLGILLVLAYGWMNPKAQLISWSVATGWLLSSVYLGYFKFGIRSIADRYSCRNCRCCLVALVPGWNMACASDLGSNSERLARSST